jgi:hypothetical protein
MALPIRFQPLARDAREELRDRLDKAPLDHAEALLAAYEVLHGLNDRGVLDILKGALGASTESDQALISSAVFGIPFSSNHAAIC